MRGYDAGKKVKGRKRHIAVDTLGLVWARVVHEAGIQDRDGAKLVFFVLMSILTTLLLVWADQGYAGNWWNGSGITNGVGNWSLLKSSKESAVSTSYPTAGSWNVLSVGMVTTACSPKNMNTPRKAVRPTSIWL